MRTILILTMSIQACWAETGGRAEYVGGTITAGTHFTKAGGRLAINASPEPVSNWLASFSEEAAVLGGLWLAFQHPVIFLLMLALFILLVIWLIPWLYRFLRAMFRRIAGWFATNPSAPVG